MYEAKTIPEAIRQFELAALPHVSALVKELGVPFDNSKQWTESKSTDGQYYRNGERDRVHFKRPTGLVSARRVRGETVPKGERTTELMTVNEYESYGTAYEVQGGYTRKRGRVVADQHSSTLGWSVTAGIEGQAGGGESSGGSYLKISLSTTVSGEQSDTHSEQDSVEFEEPATYNMTVPADKGLRVVQTVESGESSQKVTDYLELDLSFRIVDWKHLGKGSPLGGNADYTGYKSTKSRYVMGVDSIDDLRIILSGQSREYPRFLGEDWRGRPGIASHYGWLMAPGNRKIKIAGEVSYKDGLWGGVKPQLVEA